MCGPAIYRIRVQGKLDAKLADRLGGMQITEVCKTDQGPETILVGRILDQASLSGILNSLYEQRWTQKIGQRNKWISSLI